jgi:hypothetical protein
VRDFDLIHDNQCLGYGCVRLEQMMPLITTLHHPITKDRELEMSHAPSGSKRRAIRRWYRFVEMQGRVARRMPRIVVVSENSIKDIHGDMGVDLDRMRLVPVGVDIELFKPMPHVQRQPNRLITTASADTAWVEPIVTMILPVLSGATLRKIRLSLRGTVLNSVWRLRLRFQVVVEPLVTPTSMLARVSLIRLYTRTV